MSTRVPDWVLERSLVGELPEGFTEADLAADPTVPERLAALRKSDEQILEGHPPAVVAARVRQRAEQRRAPRVRPAIRWVPVAAAAALVAVVTPVVLSQRPPDVLTKGLQPHLEVYRRAQGTEERLEDGAAVLPGDVIQLRVVAAGARYAAVMASDGTRPFALVAPSSEAEQAIELPASGTYTLPEALAVDATGELERFILVTSDRPFPARDALDRARRPGFDARRDALELPSPPFAESAFLIVKKP